MGGMEQFELVLYVVFVVPCAIMAIVIPLGYLLTLHGALKKFQPENRLLRPASVWLLLIPGINIFWHFYVVLALARSLRKEYRSCDITNDQGTYGFEAGIVVLLINVFLIGWVVVARVEHTTTGELAVAVGAGAVLTQGVCLFAHWVIIAIVSGKLRSR